ncbi:hypothetical protein MJM99_33680, partial [Salmonella enterica subsp. enterica serovar Kentucky]|nr:hypothetical protein [Salmonella enterica subsp. enterica serovar Kentucky]
RQNVPYSVFMTPPLSRVGLTEEQARASGATVQVVTLPVAAIPKHWQKLLHSLIAELKPEMSGPALAVIENLEKASEQELEQMAS